MSKGLAVVTGASTGIGFELARCCVQGGYDTMIVADEPRIGQAAERLRVRAAAVSRSFRWRRISVGRPASAGSSA
jgi:short-subunit dehydrogenase